MRIFIIGIGIIFALLTIFLLLIKAFKSEQQKQYFLVCALAIGLGAVGLCVLYFDSSE